MEDHAPGIGMAGGMRIVVDLFVHQAIRLVFVLALFVLDHAAL
jgi:hypothetical protein